MIEILEFIFQDFWHWLGTLILLSSLTPWPLIKSNININKGDKEVQK
jgi:hypothetical protein|nr:MAG TPA: hypothetical protein [Caudoviricetes sp.]